MFNTKKNLIFLLHLSSSLDDTFCGKFLLLLLYIIVLLNSRDIGHAP